MNRMRKFMMLGGAPAWTPAKLSWVAWMEAWKETAYANADPVPTMTDWSGNANHATAAGAARPTFATAQVNGLPAYTFDGANQFAATAAFAGGDLATSTIFVVGKCTDGGAGYKNFVSGLTAAKRHMMHCVTSTYRFFAGTSEINHSVARTDAWRVLCGVFNGANSLMTVDGTVKTGDPGSAALAGLKIGAEWDNGSKLVGAIAAILVYSGAMSDANRILVQEYLGAKYGITLA